MYLHSYVIHSLFRMMKHGKTYGPNIDNDIHAHLDKCKFCGGVRVCRDSQGFMQVSPGFMAFGGGS